MAKLSPVKAQTTITAGELNEFFKNMPHLPQQELNEFEEDIAKVRA